MDGTSLHFTAGRDGQRTASFKVRLPALALGFALAATVPATAAFAVTEDVLLPSPGFGTIDAAGSSITATPAVPHAAAPFTAPAAPVPASPVAAPPADTAEEIGSGNASWYGRQFAGRPTASGERFNPAQMTAAHRSLPFGSKVRVTSQRTGQSIVVRINDRGPFHGNRLIDLSEAAADAIGIKASGQGRVTLSLIS